MEARKVDRQFLLGSSLLVSPVLDQVTHCLEIKLNESTI